MPITWILVADRSRARLFSMKENQKSLTEIGAFTNPEGRIAARELGRDRPPRVHDCFGHARHAIEPGSTLREKSAMRFAGRLQSMLERGCADHACSNLALIAPPGFLGALNAALGKDLRSHVVLEIAKDLTFADTGTIAATLPDALRHRA